jgi:hypothetical protein
VHQLVGTNDDGPLFKTINFVAEPEAAADQATTVENARILNEAVGGIAEHASDEMANLLWEFASPMEDITGLKDGTRTSSEFDVDDWKAAGTELVTICGPYMGGSGSVAPPADVALSGGVYGDSTMKEAILPDKGGATWAGVLPGSEEPQ